MVRYNTTLSGTSKDSCNWTWFLNCRYLANTDSLRCFSGSLHTCLFPDRLAWVRPANTLSACLQVLESKWGPPDYYLCQSPLKQTAWPFVLPGSALNAQSLALVSRLSSVLNSPRTTCTLVHLGFQATICPFTCLSSNTLLGPASYFPEANAHFQHASLSHTVPHIFLSYRLNSNSV